jgi:hypothetical protein
LRVTLDLKVPAHDIAAFAQSLQQNLHRPGFLGDPENSDAMNRLLSPGLRRKKDQARRDHGERAVPSQWITSVQVTYSVVRAPRKAKCDTTLF